MADPTIEGNRLFDPEGFHHLLQVVPFRAVADNGEVRQIIPQQRGSGAQPEITSFARNQSPDENQIKLLVGLEAALVTKTQGSAQAILRDKENLLAVCVKFGARLGRSSYDRCCMAVGSPGKRHKAVQIPQARNPLFLIIGLAETLHVR